MLVNAHHRRQASIAEIAEILLLVILPLLLLQRSCP
jgi:hypothetical protein